MQAGDAVACKIDHVAAVFQIIADVGRDIAVVFDYQNAHVSLLRSRSGTAGVTSLTSLTSLLGGSAPNHRAKLNTKSRRQEKGPDARLAVATPGPKLQP